MSYDKRQASVEFQRWSESYDRCVLQWLLFRPTHKAVLKRLEARFGERPFRLLDVGCGTGQFMERVRARFPKAEVCGVDLSGPMVRQGAVRWGRQFAHTLPVQGDSERLPFADDCFDAITCAHSFHHYPHQERAVVEMHRVLRPGGRLLLIDGNRDFVWGWFIYDVCVAAVEGAVHHCSGKRFRALTTDAGFELEEQKGHWGPAPFLVTEAVKPLDRPTIPLREPYRAVA